MLFVSGFVFAILGAVLGMSGTFENYRVAFWSLGLPIIYLGWCVWELMGFYRKIAEEEAQNSPDLLDAD